MSALLDESVVDRRTFVADLMGLVPSALVVTGLGSPTYDVASAGYRERTFFLWGRWAARSPSVSAWRWLSPTESVVVVTGDGEQLMGVGSLGTVAAAAPDNLIIVCLHNGHFGETGMQRSHTSSARSPSPRGSASATWPASGGAPWRPRSAGRSRRPLLVAVEEVPLVAGRIGPGGLRARTARCSEDLKNRYPSDWG